MNTPDTAGLFRRILFCTDFSENADFAFQYALDPVRRIPGAEFFLLHVIPEPDAQFWRTYIDEVDNAEEKARQDMAAKVDAAYRSRLPPGITMTVAMRVGSADEEILAYADEIKADLLVMGRQGRSSMGKILFGNITEKVVRKAKCSILVVPYSYEQMNKGEQKTTT